MAVKTTEKRRLNIKNSGGINLVSLDAINGKLNQLNRKATQLKKQSLRILGKKENRTAIGMFIEGQSLYVVCLNRQNNQVQLVDAENFELSDRLEKLPAPAKATGLEEILTEENGHVDLSIEDPHGKMVFSSKKRELSQNERMLRSILEKYAHKKFQIGVSLAEPQIHFSYYDGEWEPDDLDPKRKVIEELIQLRPELSHLKPEDLYLIKLADRRLMAIIRHSELDVIDLLKNVQPGILKRLAFVESAETSLVNLINTNYDFDENELSVVVYVGMEITRLVFLRGQKIFNITYILADVKSTSNLAQMVYSRLLLEQDNLHLHKVDRVILAGEANAIGLHDFLIRQLPSGVDVEFVKFDELRLFGIDSVMSRYAIAGGAALRALEDPDEQSETFYNIDLTPHAIKESQKFQLGLLGWILLFVVPLFTFSTTIRYGQQNRELAQLEMQLKYAQEELANLQELETQLNFFKTRVSGYAKMESIVDSLVHQDHSWSDFLIRLGEVGTSQRGLWITDLDQGPSGKITLRGYSTDRQRLTIFANRLGNARIDQVNVQEIREKMLFSFSLEVVTDSSDATVKTEK